MKNKFGQTSEVVNAHIQCILGLPKLNGSDPAKVYNFYETLASRVQTLDTLAKLKKIGGFVRAAVDKLPCIRPDLVRLDDDWQQWGFDKLVDALRKWCDRNPVQASDRRANSRSHGHGHSYQASQHQVRARVYFDSPEYKSAECKTGTNQQSVRVNNVFALIALE